MNGEALHLRHGHPAAGRWNCLAVADEFTRQRLTIDVARASFISLANRQPAVADVVAALDGREEADGDPKQLADPIEGPRPGRAQNAISLAKTCSIGLKSGLYGGR